jgi:hypothetical protein
MCQRLGELREGLRRLAAGFDPRLLSAADAARVVADAAAIEKTAAALKALAATRVAASGSWRREGARSAAHHLARTTGTSVAKAAEALETARRMETLPEVSAAARSGELSAEQASAIADAAGADPAAEGRLVAQARECSLGELKDRCAATKAALDDAEGRRRRLHAGRYLHTYRDREGAFCLHLRHLPEAGAQLMAAVEPIRQRLMAAARQAGRAESPEAHGADALVALAKVGTADPGQGPAEPKGAAVTKVLVRVDLPTLLRGYACEGEVCEVVGYGPVAVSAVRDMLDSGDPFLAAVVTKGVEVAGVAHLGRRPTAHQQSALEWLYPRCANVACGSLVRLEVDHRLEWARSHLTLLELLDRLCAHCHRLKTRKAWSLVPGRGRRAFVAPDDPRHPRHHRGDARPPPERADALRQERTPGSERRGRVG